MNAEERVHCVGVPVRADETRSAAVCQDSSGRERVVIVARGYALIMDPVSGVCRQLAFQEGKNEYPYAAMSGRSGLLYTGAGPLLVVLDPFNEQFVSLTEPAPGEEVVGFAFAEDVDGIVYATTYPNAKLLKLDPATGISEVVVQLDSEQKYAMSLAVGRDGWVYAGTGTTAAGIVAYRQSDGALQAVCKQSPSVRGSGHVHLGIDGEVYGRLPAADSEQGATGSVGFNWYILRDGEALPVNEESVSPSDYQGIGYRKLHKNLAHGRKIIHYELAEGELVIAEPDGRPTVLNIDYQGGGTALSPMTAGPDGKLYGTSNHPLHLYRYDPVSDELTNFGGKIVEGGGGGNICAYASQDPYLIGAAYAGGLLHLIDTRNPLSRIEGASPNPKLIYEDDRIHRPRSALAHPDGIHVLYGGFPDYGSVGGALGIVHIPTQSVQIVDHHTVVPYQSTLGLAALSNGDVIGCTSIETPGGAEPIATEALLYRLRWHDRVVSEKWVPIPRAREISLLTVDAKDRVYGLTSDSIWFVFDPGTGNVVHRQDLTAWGSIVRQGLLMTDRGVIGLLSHSLFTVDPTTLMVRQLAYLPKAATSGIAFLHGDVYYGCGAELWRYKWEEGESL